MFINTHFLNETSVSKMKQVFQIDEEKTKKILSLFFENPTESYYLRQIANIVKISPSTVSRRMKALISSQLLKVMKKKLILEVKANLDSKEFLEAKKEYNLKKIKSLGLLDILIERYSYPEAIILHGSYAKGEDDGKSDVDIAVITKKRLNLELDNFEKKLKRKIHIIETTKKDIKAEFMNNLINGIILYGYLKIK